MLTTANVNTHMGRDRAETDSGGDRDIHRKLLEQSRDKRKTEVETEVERWSRNKIEGLTDVETGRTSESTSLDKTSQ